MSTNRASAQRAWLGVIAGVGLLQFATTAAAAAPGCVEAKVNLASVSMSDFVQSPGGGWVPGTTSINGTASTPKVNQGGTYQWSIVGPRIGTLAGANTPQVTYTAPDVSGTQQTTLRLTVTSPTCGSNSVDIPVTIADAWNVVQNTAPHAIPTASPASPAEGTVVTLDGSASTDAEHDALTYTWTQIGGPAVTLQATGNPATRTFVAPNLSQNTLLTFRLTVSDGKLTGTDTTFVNVAWTNDAPVAALACPVGVIDANEGASVMLDGSGSTDSDDGIVKYEWQQMVGDPAIPDLGTATGSTVTFNAPSLGYMQDGMVPVKLTVTDASGAKSSAQCAVFIHDVTAPSITVPSPSPATAEATSATGADVGYVATAFDAVDGDLAIGTENFICEAPSGSHFPIDATTAVLCSAKDSAGNTAEKGFSIRVTDSVAPVIDSPAAIGVEATGPSGAAATYSILSHDVVDGTQAAVCTPVSGSTFAINAPGPTTTVSCGATDAHGNAATPVTFEVTVHDTTAPSFDASTVSADITKEATSAAGAVATFALPSANDLVDLAAVTVTCAPASGSTFALGETTVSCDATDSRHNSTKDESPATTATFKVTVADTTPPVFSGMPASTTLEATSAAGAAFTYVAPTAADIVDGNVAVSCTPASGTFALGVTAVACTAGDAHGNVATGGFNVTVADTTAPSLLLPSTLTAEATGASGAKVAFAAFANDAVDSDVVASCSAASGDTFPLGTTTVTCSATDDSGNTSHGSFDVVVRDTTAPAIAAHADVSANATGNSSANVQYVLPTATDLVDGSVTVACAPASGSSFNVGTTVVNCSATDSHGNRATSSFNVSVGYAFTGFFQPVDNYPAVNSVKAGSAVPVKFALGGNQGLGIFQTGSPTSGVAACGTTAEDVIEETVTAGNSSLQYDSTSGQYIYVWKTEKSWVGTCRVLRIGFKDGKSQTAMFKFK